MTALPMPSDYSKSREGAMTSNDIADIARLWRNDPRAAMTMTAPFVTKDRKAEITAWVGAALGRSKRAVRYRRMAEEAALEGNATQYALYQSEARSNQHRAWDALSFARLEKDAAEAAANG